MNVDGVNSIPYDGFGGTGINFHIWFSNRLQYGPSIEGGLIQSCIAVYGGDT